MVSGYWRLASVLVLIISTSVVLTDSPNCNSSDQHCLVIPKTDALTHRKELNNRERQLTRETTIHQERSERDSDRHRDHLQTKFLVHTNRDSRRLYDRIRDVKKSVLDQRNDENLRESRRLRGNRRYLAGEQSRLHSIETDSAEQGATRSETLRDRLHHRFALSASENGYLTARAQRRFARFHDDIENARITTRFERLQKNRMAHLNHGGDDGDDGVRVVSRFERNRKDRMTRLSRSDVSDLRTISETDRTLPHHFQNLKRIRERIGRRESGFDRRNAYAAVIRNQVRLSDGTVKAGEDKIEPRFEIQRKHRQELEVELKKEIAEGEKTEEQDAFMENRKMRKEQRRKMEEQMIREEKQRLLEEERKIREEAERVRESERRMRETERRIKEILHQIRENERKARDEKHRNRQPISERERDADKLRDREERFNIHGDGDKIHYNSGEEVKDYTDKFDFEDYSGERQMFDYSHEYSDYSDSDSSESYEDDWELERQLREDIRLFPDIQRQIRENVQMYGREVLDARETSSSDEVDDKSHTNDERRTVHKEEENNRRKRSLEIAERRPFRSQNERLIRRVNLRQMDQVRRFKNRAINNEPTNERRRNADLEERRNNGYRLVEEKRTNRQERGNFRNHRSEAKENSRNLERRNNLITVREETERINDFDQQRIKSESERNNEQLEKNSRRETMERRENEKQIRYVRDEVTKPRSEQSQERRREFNEVISDSRDRRINSEILSRDNQRTQQTSDEMLSVSQMKYTKLNTVNTIQLLQAALIGIVVLKVIMEQKFFEKKFRTNFFFKSAGSILNNLKVY